MHCPPQTNERKTQPPQHFTDATLLSAMTNIARFVADNELRKTLRETDGLGTEATRAAIIDTLFRRDYLFREKRFIRATDKGGKSLIAALPESIRTPDRTAVWEATLEGVAGGAKKTQERFWNPSKMKSADSCASAAAGLANTETPGTAIHCPKCRAPMVEREGKFGAFFACTRYPPACKAPAPPWRTINPRTEPARNRYPAPPTVSRPPWCGAKAKKRLVLGGLQQFPPRLPTNS